MPETPPKIAEKKAYQICVSIKYTCVKHKQKIEMFLSNKTKGMIEKICIVMLMWNSF